MRQGNDYPNWRETCAKVTGRVVGGDDRADYTGLRLVFNRAIPSQATGLVHEGHNVARAECAADGTFTCWLPAGRFRVTPIATAKWKAGMGWISKLVAVLPR